jgi:hypothetical protein
VGVSVRVGVGVCVSGFVCVDVCVGCVWVWVCVDLWFGICVGVCECV